MALPASKSNFELDKPPGAEFSGCLICNNCRVTAFELPLAPIGPRLISIMQWIELIHRVLCGSTAPNAMRPSKCPLFKCPALSAFNCPLTVNGVFAGLIIRAGQ
jgi:hypothetical protein